MSSRTAEVCSLRRLRSGLHVGLLVTAMFALSACEDDVGRCCQVLDPDNSGRIPTSTLSSSGQPTSDIALDPDFDCESLICVAYRGTRAFCTARCFSAEECPEGFSCEPVLESDPGPGTEIQPGDRFCVRADHVCSE